MANYFVTLYNRTTIQFWASDMTHDSHFEQLTTAQEDFYVLNPTASVTEIRNCLLNEIPVVQQLTLDDIKTNALKNISDLALTVLGQFVNDYQLANSLSSIT